MQPLNPEDLLIRLSPVELEQQADGQPQAAGTRISLERFQQLEQTLREHPLNVAPYLELAQYYLSVSRWTDARRVLELACQRFPEEEQAQFLLEEAQLARSLQLYHAAEQAFAVEPSQLTQAPLDASRLELNVLREKICRQRLARHPQQIALNLPLATALYNLGQSEQAMVALRSAMLEPKLRAAAAFQLGQLLEEAKRVPEALSLYRRSALFRVPPPPRELKRRALSAAADLAERSQLIDSARHYVKLLLDLQPDDADLQSRLARLQATPL